MNLLQYFVGTRRKQWRFIIFSLIVMIVGYIYWLGKERTSSDKVETRAKSQNSSKLWSHLLDQPYITAKKANVEAYTPELSTETRNASLFEVQTTVSSTSQKRSTVAVSKIALSTGRTERSNSRSTTRKFVTRKDVKSTVKSSFKPHVSYGVHIFYYPWYGNPAVDDRYIHWDHRYLPHWNPEISKRYKKGVHKPPNDIGSDFYPELGCYSSSDPATVEEHMRQIRTSGAGVVVVSWYPVKKADDQGIPVDRLIPMILNKAGKYGLKVTLHIEPYKDRNEKTVREDVIYIIQKYSNHPAFYKYKTTNNRYLPLLYVYDSYHTKPQEWANLLKPDGPITIRDTPYDCIMIALMVELMHREFIEIGGFDGFYTYFAVNGFTYGSTWNSWPKLKSFAKQTGSIFIPSVGPGYIDTSIRPWNFQNTRSRQNGDYYKKSFQAALAVNPPLISITSFNEWHEGTQIEKAVPKSSGAFKYKDYLPHEADYYLKMTRKYVETFEKANKNI